VQLVNTTLTRSGIEVGNCDILVHVKICKGYIQHPDGTIQRQLAAEETSVPLQVGLCSYDVPPQMGWYSQLLRYNMG